MITRLEYHAPPESGGLLVDERPDGGVTITVPTRRATFLGVLRMLAKTHPLSVVATPLIWPVVRVLASKNPRAIIRLTPEEFILTETSENNFGHKITATSWPRSSIGELRPNRYSNGLYFRVPGKQNLDLLADLPAATIKTIGAALEAAQARLAAQATAPVATAPPAGPMME
jgi:hypothetical protein